MRKTLSFAALHFTVAFSVGWLMTGSWLVGGALALVEPACNTVVFHFHEKVWKRIEARRNGGRTPDRTPSRHERNGADQDRAVDDAASTDEPPYFFFGMYRSVMLPS